MTDGLTRILVVDDDEKIGNMVSKMLSSMGYEVISTDSGEKGFDLFLLNQFDIVITDIEMPGMDGWSLVFEIKKISPNTTVILMTGHDKNEILDKFKQSSANHVLFKPFRDGEIEETIQYFMNPLNIN